MIKALYITIGLSVLILTGISIAIPLQSLPALFETDPDLGLIVISELRLPRALLALVYGAILGASGAAIQALFANPLASPDITGATGGAALGAVTMAYLIGFASPLGIAIGGVSGAGIALALLLLLAGPRAETATLLLAGIAISTITGAGTALALALAPSPFAFYDAYDWLMGSLVDRSLTQLAFAGIPALAVLFYLTRCAPALDRLVLGEDVAEAMGHDIGAMRRNIIAATAIGVGAAVSVCGAVGFIGLVGPVLARKLTGGHPGRAILPAALIGAILLLSADIAVRFAPPDRSLPIGVLTAILGAPFFLSLVARMRWSARP
ncbi:FecCD family ABC transporter permease [Parasphingopyxis lamellibrachiae]|uniref:Iron complex transport system permease protein n=1 Tax=Parasphingopyxis lamellibrachiae TaxID=680125 RepID=A0A3D9FEU9_9SPHN|nr:iron ABC transporter permease [Parasphingopyxis lamellibrachiae]RED15591.1 iron complex transport system permease protein [Parasphingopyxis lamellibrachiae]